VQGELVHAMQAMLPPKTEREAGLADPQRWGDMIRLARAAATAAALARGLRTRTPPDLPAFVPSP
jgi:hypothetical protein